MPYAFRLAVPMAPGSTLASPSSGPSQTVQLCEHEFGKPMQLEIIEDGTNDSTVLEIRAEDFPTEADGRVAGERAKWALRVAAIQSDLGLDLGDDKSPSGMASAVREMMEAKTGSQIIMDVRGLHVYEGTADAKVFRVSAKLTVEKNADTFARDFSFAYEDEASTSEKASLAMDLYSLSKFEVSERARCLALVSALEVLSERSRRPAEVLDHLLKLSSKTRRRLREPRANDRLWIHCSDR